MNSENPSKDEQVLDAPSRPGSATMNALEAARLLGVHERTIRRAIERGKLVADRRGGAFRIRQADLQAYRIAQRLQRQTTTQTVIVRTPDRTIGALPMALTPVIGRDHDIASACSLLTSPGVRLLTLTGPGGSGKTRLGLAAAHELTPHFQDGAVFVSLEAVPRLDLVPVALARALGITPDEVRPLMETVKAVLYSRHLLLVLDNFEHLLPAASTIAALLAACPGLSCLVTSREPLRIRGEYVREVAPLPLPPREETRVAALLGSPAVQLFVQRARAVEEAFTLHQGNASAVATICRQLDGLPLAIELAAARVRSLPPALLLERLEQCLDLLSSGAVDLPSRLQTMRGAIAWSYELLSPEEQSVFCRLAVFTGGFDLPAVLALDFPELPRLPEVEDILHSLTDKHLVRTLDKDAAPRRYTLLETVHVYALEQLRARGWEWTTRRAHAAHFEAMARAASAHYHGPEEMGAFAVLETNFANIQSALVWSMSDEGEIRIALQLCDHLWWFWYVRGYFREAWQVLDALVNNERAGHWPREQARAILAAGWIVSRMLEPAQAQILHGEARARCLAYGDQVGAAFALCGLAFNFVLGFGEPESARPLLLQARKEFQHGGSRWMEAACCWGLTIVALALNDLDEAEAWSRKSYAISSADGDAQGIAASLANLGRVARLRGHFAEALGHFQRALYYFDQISDRGNVCTCVDALAGLLVSLGQPQQATRLFGASAALRERIGAPPAAHERAGYEADLAAARAALDPRDFTRDWASGWATPLHHVLPKPSVSVLHDSASLETAPARPEDGDNRFTPREREVLRLLINGRTDREIGRSLSISPATATKHVSNILNKLNVPSRTLAAVVAVLLGLA